MIYSGLWKISAVNVPGPDSVSYLEPQALGLRLDSFAVRQGIRGLEWRYTTITSDEMKILLDLWRQCEGHAVTVGYIDPITGEFTEGWFSYAQPLIGRRRTFLYDSVSIRFLPGYRSTPVGFSTLAMPSVPGMGRFLADELTSAGGGSLILTPGRPSIG